MIIETSKSNLRYRALPITSVTTFSYIHQIFDILLTINSGKPYWVNVDDTICLTSISRDLSSFYCATSHAAWTTTILFVNFISQSPFYPWFERSFTERNLKVCILLLSLAVPSNNTCMNSNSKPKAYKKSDPRRF